MEFFRIKKDIPFMRHALVFNVISLLTFVLAVFFLVTKGLHLPGLGPRRRQAIVLQQAIRLLHRTQAHTMLGA